MTDTIINSMNYIDSVATTISISHELKEKLKNLGRVGDTYEDVIERMYEQARKNILKHYLYDTSDCVSIDQALAEARSKNP